MDNINQNDFSRELLGWFDAHKRTLPWRKNTDPYRVLVSEFMLQQTQVKTVIPYYERFINAIPNFHALAMIDEETLHKLWQGLGYYRRAQSLKKLAIEVVNQFNGVLPDNPHSLIQLPGIGPYISGAVASIAFQKPVPAIDGNVRRVISRCFAIEDPSGSGNSSIHTRIQTLIDPQRPGDFNQALMEVGALICLPTTSPKCPECPLKDRCQAKLLDRISQYPAKLKRPFPKTIPMTVFLLQRGDRYAIQKRPEGGLLAGLWEFPNIESRLDEAGVMHWAQIHDIEMAQVFHIGRNVHRFTHIVWDMDVYRCQIRMISHLAPYVWATLDEIYRSYALPQAFLKLLDRI
ncbi:MAG: A/G-specific adenine glycosylase [Candidatus Izemoplasmatales bacterium]